MKRLRLLTLVAFILAGSVYYIKSIQVSPTTIAYNERIPDDWFKSEGEKLTPWKDRRKGDQTFLTYPEWFLVFSPEEQAEFFKTKSQTDFNYQDHLDQFWDSYEIIKKPIEKHYEYNAEYHQMIQVIGGSTQIEYSLKSWYETVIGRMTNYGSLSEEDVFTQKYTDDYARSLHEVFWYDFDYKGRFKSLWKDNSFWGMNMPRKLERKYVLSSELLVKKVYADLIRYGAHSMYGESPVTTGVIVDRLTNKLKMDSTIEIVEKFPDGKAFLRVPRYTAFMGAAKTIANENVNFIEVAGNKSCIMITILVNDEEPFHHSKTRLLFSQSISTDPSLRRIAFVTRVQDLAFMIRYLDEKKIKIEHIFDY